MLVLFFIKIGSLPVMDEPFFFGDLFSVFTVFLHTN